MRNAKDLVTQHKLLNQKNSIDRARVDNPKMETLYTNTTGVSPFKSKNAQQYSYISTPNQGES